MNKFIVQDTMHKQSETKNIFYCNRKMLEKYFSSEEQQTKQEAEMLID